MDVLIRTETQLRQLSEKLAAHPKVGLDYETTSDHPSVNGSKPMMQWDKLKPAGWGWGFPDQTKYYVPVAHSCGTVIPYGMARDQLKRVLEDKTKQVVCHNAKFERKVTRVLRIKPACEWRCSMLVQWLMFKGLRGYGHKLKPTVLHYLKHKMLDWDDVVPPGLRAHDIPAERMAPYCGDDALQGLNLEEFWLPELNDLGMGKVYIELEMPFISVLNHMDEVGVNIDRPFLQDLYDRYSAEMQKLRIDFMQLTKASISSHPQISRRLIDELKWWRPTDGRGKNGSYSIAVGAREQMARRLKKGSPGWIAMQLKERFQRIQKLVSTFTVSLIDKADRYLDGRLRSNLKQHGTDTGRMSSSDPNLQQIPIRTEEGKQIRAAFIPEEGWDLLDCDYSQADLRMMAHLSQDPDLMEAYIQDVDIHQKTADATGTDRDAGKVTNLGLIYEMSPSTLAANIGCSDHEGKRIWHAWHNSYSRVQTYHKRMHSYARKNGLVRTITGRIRPIEDLDAGSYGMRRYKERQASNTPCQGSVADVIKIAMRNLLREWEDRGVLYDVYEKTGKAKVMMQIHDELVIELRHDFKEEGAADVQRHMENAVELRVPMKAEPSFGANWLEAH